MRLLAWLLLLAPLGGCAKARDPAPQDLDGLLHYVYRHYEGPDALQEAMGNLGPWLDTTGRTDAASEGYRLTPLTEQDVADIDRPEGDLVDAKGVAVAAVSTWPVEPHAEITLQADQIYNDPHSYSVYDRSIYEGDPPSFLEREGTVRTLNDIDKTKVGVTIPYTLYKDFTWVNLDDTHHAIVARSWIQDGSCGSAGSNCLNQSFSIDLWYASDDVDTVRMTATWNDVTSVADAFLSEDQKVAIAVHGILAIFENTDQYLDDTR